MKRSLILISVGLLNLLHASFHVIQFIQSILLVAYSVEEHKHEHYDGWIDSMLHNPFFAILWGVIGIITLIIGIRDYRHHRKCAHEHDKTEIHVEKH